MSRAYLSFLRHAKVPSHEGDMPLTDDAQAQIDAAVPLLRDQARPGERFVFLATRTKRSQHTAEMLREAIDPAAPEVIPAWGLRNPDLYMAGSRVEMVSTPEAFTAQFPEGGMSPEDVLAQSFFRGFLTAPDRIEYWLTHDTPPGENAAAVAKRVIQFARSFTAWPGGGVVVACVTHSPVMRALLVQGLGIPDPGEPGWVEGIDLEVAPDGAISYRFRDHSGML